MKVNAVYDKDIVTLSLVHQHQDSKAGQITSNAHYAPHQSKTSRTARATSL